MLHCKYPRERSEGPEELQRLPGGGEDSAEFVFFFFFFVLFIYFFSCVGSSFLCEGFL